MAPIGYGYGSEWHLLYYLGRRRASFTRLVQEEVNCVQLQWCDHEEYVEPPPPKGSGLRTVRERRGRERAMERPHGFCSKPRPTSTN